MRDSPSAARIRSVLGAAVLAMLCVRAGDLSTLSGQVYVVRSGNAWFVWDPAYRFHSESPFVYMRFDRAWTLERKFELD